MKYPSGLLVLFIVPLLIGSCNDPKSSATGAESTEVQELHGLPVSWIENRVKKAEVRLNKTEAGKVVWQVMQAHGGLKNWYSKGPLAFRFNYQPIDGSTQRDSYQVIDSEQTTVDTH